MSQNIARLPLDILRDCIEADSESAFVELMRIVDPVARTFVRSKRCADSARLLKEFPHFASSRLFERRCRAKASGSKRDPLFLFYDNLKNAIAAGECGAEDAEAQHRFLAIRLPSLFLKSAWGDYWRDADRGKKRRATENKPAEPVQHDQDSLSGDNDQLQEKATNASEEAGTHSDLLLLYEDPAIMAEWTDSKTANPAWLSDALDAGDEVERVLEIIDTLPTPKRALFRLRLFPHLQTLGPEDRNYVLEKLQGVPEDARCLNLSLPHHAVCQQLMDLINTPENQDGEGRLRWTVLEVLLGESQSTLNQRFLRTIKDLKTQSRRD